MSERFSPDSYLAEELEARGWTTADLAARMPGDAPTNLLAVDMMIAVSDPNLIVDRDMSERLGVALGVSPQLFENLSRSYSRPNREVKR